MILNTFLQRKAAEKAEKPARKTKKDPNAPKRALSAYMFFSQDWRERIKTENPDAGFGQSYLSLTLQCSLTSKQVKLVNCWVLNGRSLMTKRRRYISAHNVNDLFNSPFPFQPYVEQAARDKERAEEEKTAYDVRLLYFLFPS